MTRSTIAGGTISIVLILIALALTAALWDREEDLNRDAALSPGLTPTTGPVTSDASQSFLYGRLTTDDGTTYEGRLRWGGDEEAFWGDYFNGVKDKNPWVTHVPPEQLKESRPLKIFGLEIAHWESRIDLGRPFMARLGDIARIEANGRDLRVTLKSGTLFHLDRFAADDFADGIRVWDDKHGVVDFGEGRIRSIRTDLIQSTCAGPKRRRSTSTDRRLCTRRGVSARYFERSENRLVRRSRPRWVGGE